MWTNFDRPYQPTLHPTIYLWSTIYLYLIPSGLKFLFAERRNEFVLSCAGLRCSCKYIFIPISDFRPKLPSTYLVRHLYQYLIYANYQNHRIKSRLLFPSIEWQSIKLRLFDFFSPEIVEYLCVRWILNTFTKETSVKCKMLRMHSGACVKKEEGNIFFRIVKLNQIESK